MSADRIRKAGKIDKKAIAKQNEGIKEMEIRDVSLLKYPHGNFSQLSGNQQEL